MKRFLALTLLLCLALSGCRATLPENAVEFFYCRSEDSWQPGLSDTVISSEQRSFTSHRDDLAYLLVIYLQGPQDPLLRAPFPIGCRLISTKQVEDTLIITLDSPFTRLEDMDLTLACACIAKTAMGITDAQQVNIRAGTPRNENYVNMTIGRDQLMLEDTTQLPAEGPTE